jgi:hypothetical protein
MKYRDIINYFTSLASLHPTIEHFSYGDYERILGAERDTITYPCMWLESPVIKFIGDTESHSKKWSISFVILMNSAMDDEVKKENNIDECEQICYDIIAKCMHDGKNGVFKNLSISDIEMDLVTSKNNDNDQGWRVELVLYVRSNLSCDQSIWEPTP